MANPEHVDLLKRVDNWNRWRRDNPTAIPDLREANLRGANLHGANLEGVDLTGADLTGADLRNAVYSRNTIWPDNFSASARGALPVRTNTSKTLFIQQTAAVLGRAKALLISQALVVVALVYVQQGRAFLLLDDASALPYMMLLGAAATVAFARVLADPVYPDQNINPESDDRIRWLALQCGSLVAGLISGFLPAGLIEAYVAGGICGTPRQILDSYRGFAATVTMLVVIVLEFYLVQRIQRLKKEETGLRDTVLVVLIPLAGWLSNQISSTYHLLIFGALLIAAVVLMTMTVLRGPGPHKIRGGIVEWRFMLLAGLFIAVGIALAIFPDMAPSGVALCIVLDFWTSVALLFIVGLRYFWSDRLAWYFGLLAVLFAGMIALSSHAFQARAIRLLSGRPPARPALADFSKQWLQRRLDRPAAGHGPYTIILVAAAGGGIRAAYWTANLLAAFEDAHPGFAQHVFAISSVSGSSVGAAVFDALMQSHCQPCRPPASAILRGDFLAPALVALLTRDVASTVLPFDLPDRGIALEQAFEHSWRNAMHTQTLEESFDQLWKGDSAQMLPSLFLNSTEAGSAKRVVFTNVSMSGVKDLDGSIEGVAQGLSLRLSTAMLLSARFPYISPEGRAGAKGEYRFVDGGYFDNSGSATLLDVVASIRQTAADLGMAERVRIATLVIGNDPVGANCPPSPEPGGVGTPVEILDQLRSVRADDFIRRLRELVSQRPGDLFLDSFQPVSGDAEFPLGWMLPSVTWQDMDKQIEQRMKDRSSPMSQLLQSLR